MENQPAAGFLRDLGSLVAERAAEAKLERDASPDDGFASGRLMAFHEVVSLMQQQADAFGMTHEEVGLSGISPERDLI
jgi:hypothetical protein